MFLQSFTLDRRIRRSIDADLPIIESWLRQYEALEPHSTFLCNWETTLESHTEGDLLVYVDPISAHPVGYLWGQLIRTGILEVRPDMRGRGIGTAIVQHALYLADLTDEPILKVQCEPMSSVGFWTRMGFTILPRDSSGRVFGYHVVPPSEPLEAQGTAATVTIEWGQAYPAEGQPSFKQQVRGVVDDNIVYLAERAFCPSIVHRKPVVQVTVDETVWYQGSSGSLNAGHAGITACLNGSYIDYLVRL